MPWSRSGRRGIPLGGNNYFADSEWNAQCDQCGRFYKASEITEQWDHLRVCQQCWDPRHPQELIRPVVDPKPVPWSRPWIPTVLVQPDVYRTSRSINGAPLNFQSLN